MKQIKEKLSKTDIIEKVHNADDGFGSIRATLADAKRYDKTISYDDVKEWFSKQEFGQRAKMRGMNSFIAHAPKEEYQCDLFFMADQNVNEKLKNALLMVDIFTKYTAVVLIRSKQVPDVLDGLKRCIEKMGGKPQTIYMDEEGAVQSNVIQKYFKDEDIRHITTYAHAPVAERQIRTIKSMIYKRIEHTKKEWFEVLDQVLNTYNNKMVHTVTRFTPSDARKPENQAIIKMNLELRSRRTRVYKNISVGDYVRAFKKKDKLDKERKSNWSKDKYKVVEIQESMGQQFYKLEGLKTIRLRSEILLVNE